MESLELITIEIILLYEQDRSGGGGRKDAEMIVGIRAILIRWWWKLIHLQLVNLGIVSNCIE